MVEPASVVQAPSAAVGCARSATALDAVWRFALRCGFRMARLWWSVRRPRHEGVQAAIHVQDRLLLLKSSYRREWNFPGGGVERRETPEQALRRELAEEIGLCPSTLVPAGSASGLWEGRRDTVHYFELRLDRTPDVHWDNREIVGARLFRLADLDDVAVTGPVRAYVAARTPGDAPDRS